MAKHEEYLYKGYWIKISEFHDRNNPALVIKKWSVWGLGIYNSAEDATRAVDNATNEKERIKENGR